MFPEGTRRSGPVVEDLHNGVAFLAARLGVPIVPIGIGGSETILARDRKVPKLNRVVVIVGEPIHPPAREPGASVRRRDVAGPDRGTARGRPEAFLTRQRHRLWHDKGRPVIIRPYGRLIRVPGGRGCPPKETDETGAMAS